MMGLFFLLFGASLTAAELDVMTGQECVDNHPDCPYWASIGECTANKGWMGDNCRKSCQRCQLSTYHIFFLSSLLEREFMSFVVRSSLKYK